MKSVLIFVFTLILFIPSCKKEKVYNLTEKEKQLTSHGWKPYSLAINGVESTLNSWFLDDCWIFRKDGSCTYYHGTIHSPTLKESDLTSTWELSVDGKTIIYGGTSFSIDITLNKMALIYFGDNGYIRIWTYVPC